jgi:Zn-dependent M28 family amino/carboxypeptidase
VRNIEAEIDSRDDPPRTLVVGAHYDSAAGSPGANDNATGVAALLELARMLKNSNPGLRIRFVAFGNEEPPYFQTESMGSRRYAAMAYRRNEKITGMLALETLGCYSSSPGSQQYPLGFGLLYPNRGNFIGFVGNLSSRAVVRRSIDAFRKTTRFPSQGIAAPGWFTGVGWSDHWSFWKEGIAALMITDTALFRYPYYHTSEDTPDKVDCERTARVVSGVARVIAELAR